jgi:UDP-2,3-diacylglucosamine pyrophosphatase LpxH
MLERVADTPTRVRTLFLSDIHLGTKGCQADALIDFLREYEADDIYLVGDIVDGWQLKSGWYWPQAHNDVVQKILRKARKGARVVYIPGNHDEFLRDYYGTHWGGIEVVEDAVHVAANGLRYLVIHGDLFDVVIRHARWLALLGDKAYELAIRLNTICNTMRKAFGLTYWSLSQWAKLRVKNAVNGVICGHIHHAAIRRSGRFCYINCGDWVESCTAAVEHFDGSFEIVTWAKQARPAREPALAIVDTRAQEGAPSLWNELQPPSIRDLPDSPMARTAPRLNDQSPRKARGL